MPLSCVAIIENGELVQMSSYDMEKCRSEFDQRFGFTESSVYDFPANKNGVREFVDPKGRTCLFALHSSLVYDELYERNIKNWRE